MPWDTGSLAASRTLFEPDWPPGFHYREDFITDADERVLLEAIADAAFADLATHEIALDPRSAYLMTGESRQAYEHHIPPVAQLRYSMTFRTLR